MTGMFGDMDAMVTDELEAQWNISTILQDAVL